MLKAVASLTLLSQLQTVITTTRTCVPNTQFLLNGRICYCDYIGQWSEANCLQLSRRQNCQPGQVIWQGCSQCICQENGQLICNIGSCAEEMTPSPYRESLVSVGIWCTPFRSYYIDCNICVCPASGRSSEARCAKDANCSTHRVPSSADLLVSVNKNVCLPKVMYLFPCLQCLCSDEGFFVIEKCIETCPRQLSKTNLVRKCTPKTFYRKNCNVCFCPDNGLVNDKLCTEEKCKDSFNSNVPNSLRNDNRCTPYTFTAPRCLYCDCNPTGTINQNSCLELYCLNFSSAENSETRYTCISGEMVPVCTECLCLQNGTTDRKYCTKSCSNDSKFKILENLAEDNNFRKIMDWNHMKATSMVGSCTANSVYKNDKGQFCLCPEDGHFNRNLCTFVPAKKEFDFDNPESEFTFKEGHVSIDFNATCEPSTFVEFDCNSCFCSQQGTIDPKWCTYDDCEAKKQTQQSSNIKIHPKKDDNGKCTPGCISKVDCNFCLCTETGLNKDRTCTKNRCTEPAKSVATEKFTCEPLTYYEVDCNICYCPYDGLKNLAKCTKNVCEKSFRRTESCVAGDLFSDKCNVCVCPPNGDKRDKVCTRHKCPTAASEWKRIYKPFEGFLGNNMRTETLRNLDLCFRGEEFVVGCKLCVCPDMGLRSYATCTNMFCNETKEKEDEFNTKGTKPAVENSLTRRKWSSGSASEEDLDGCFIYNITDSAERKKCTPGSMYIIRCRQCICPYMGNINHFCRPLPVGVNCEQAYPGYNYLPMGRKANNGNSSVQNGTENQSLGNGTYPKHVHTKYNCKVPGRVMDKCYICECDDDQVIIREHCFHSNADDCKGVEPSFFDGNKLLIP